ncbi:MAG: serpin family protein [Wujia sp.]
MRKNTKRLVSLAVVGTMLLGMTACGKKSDSSEDSVDVVNYEADNLIDEVEAMDAKNREPDEAYIHASAAFSIELFKKSIADDLGKGENVLISPESVMTALAMAANGADGDTLTQMEAVICPGLNINSLNEYLYTYNNSLSDVEDVEFSIANSIWFRDNEDRIKINDGFLCLDKTYYNAAAYKEPFDNETLDKINGWVNEETKGMIPELLKEIPDEAVMYLINAIAFEGEWQTPYQDTQINEQAEFTNSKGEIEISTALMSTEDIYLKGDNAQGFMKYYKGQKLAFMAILPDEGVSVEDYVADMTAESYMDLIASKSYEDVIVQLPEFTYSYGTELNNALIDMGMEDAFEETADFSRMADTQTGELFISRVIHKTFIQVDRKGTKAAAVTAIETNDGCEVVEEPPKNVILDRPFVYAIVDTETGLPIFIGAVHSLK